MRSHEWKISNTPKSYYTYKLQRILPCKKFNLFKSEYIDRQLNLLNSLKKAILNLCYLSQICNSKCFQEVYSWWLVGKKGRESWYYVNPNPKSKDGKEGLGGE